MHSEDEGLFIRPKNSYVTMEPDVTLRLDRVDVYPFLSTEHVALAVPIEKSRTPHPIIDLWLFAWRSFKTDETLGQYYGPLV